MNWLALLLAGLSPDLTQTHPCASIAVDHGTDAYSLDEILDAIRSVETGGERDGGRNAIGDGGRAIGPYQIHRDHWLDTGMPGRHEDCRDPLYARHEVLAYWARWCPTALAGRDAETLARVHNGGPRGSSKTSTLAYWKKTKLRLEAARSRAHVPLPTGTAHSWEPHSVLPAALVLPSYGAPRAPSPNSAWRNTVR